jgi:hypothetical protein
MTECGEAVRKEGMRNDGWLERGTEAELCVGFHLIRYRTELCAINQCAPLLNNHHLQVVQPS